MLPFVDHALQDAGERAMTPADREIGWLFPDPRSAAIENYRRTKNFPIIISAPSAGGQVDAPELELSVAAGDYDRIRPLIDGTVVIDGVVPVFMALEPEEIFFRAFRHAEFDIAELSALQLRGEDRPAGAHRRGTRLRSQVSAARGRLRQDADDGSRSRHRAPRAGRCRLKAACSPLLRTCSPRMRSN